MKEVDSNRLKQAVEGMYAGTATLAETVPVKEMFGSAIVWEGNVHVFDLTGNPKATRAYAWSSTFDAGAKRKFFAVLHIPPVGSPQAAVRAAIVEESRAPQGLHGLPAVQQDMKATG